MLKKYFLSIILGVGIMHSAFAGLTLPTTYSHYYFFGDSLSDMGNYQSGVSQDDCTLNLTPNAPVTNTVTQGGTNAGNVWTNISEYGFNATPSDIGGNDYAVAGNVSQQVFNAENLQDTTTQINKYLSAHDGIADPHALYVIWVGSNDLIHLFDSSHASLASTTTPQQIIQEGMNNIFTGIDKLYKAGAVNFLVMNLPDISDTPAVSNPARIDADTPAFYYLFVGDFYTLPVCNTPGNLCAPLIQEACNAWNNTLFGSSGTPSPGTAPLKFLKAIHPNIVIYSFNIQSLLNDIVDNPEHFGYSHDTITFNSNFSQNPSDPFDIPTASYPNNQTVSCGNIAPDTGYTPDDYIFYDYIHPTSYTHTLLARYIRQGGDSELGHQYLSLVTAP